jgi:hypothetical protein
MASSNRWYPVLKRYIDYLAGRVNGLGGKANQIPPSFDGAPSGILSAGQPTDHGGKGREERNTGKISGLIFDHFGDLEGFVLDIGSGERRFLSRERDVRDQAERAWRDRLRITVWTEPNEPRRIRTIIVREPPAALKL